MTDYKKKYIKYKTKYLNIQSGGATNFFILHSPHPQNKKDDIKKEHRDILSKIEKLGKVHNYFFKFGSIDTTFNLSDLTYENAALDILHAIENLNDVIIVCFEEASQYGLYFVDNFPNICKAIVCFPLRLDTKESLERYIWKYKDKKGWSKYVSSKYDIDDYLLNISDDRLKTLFEHRSEKEEGFILYSIVTYSKRKQYEKVPLLFKIPTYLFTRLDLSAVGVLEKNFERKAIADMKENASKNDALFNSMMWNFARVQYDEGLMKANENNDNLRIQYIVGDFLEMSKLDLLDRLKLLTN